MRLGIWVKRMHLFFFFQTAYPLPPSPFLELWWLSIGTVIRDKLLKTASRAIARHGEGEQLPAYINLLSTHAVSAPAHLSVVKKERTTAAKLKAILADSAFPLRIYFLVCTLLKSAAAARTNPRAH